MNGHTEQVAYVADARWLSSRDKETLKRLVMDGKQVANQQIIKQ
jgi:hypothetical protein